MTEQIDWQAKQPSQVTCISEDLMCWGSWDTTCGHKAKDITPLIAWRRETYLKRKCSEIFLETERMRNGHRQSGQHWNCFKGNTGETPETGWSAYGLSQAHRYHLELNWTELVGRCWGVLTFPLTFYWSSSSSRLCPQKSNNCHKMKAWNWHRYIAN